MKKKQEESRQEKVFRALGGLPTRWVTTRDTFYRDTYAPTEAEALANIRNRARNAPADADRLEVVRRKMLWIDGELVSYQVFTQVGEATAYRDSINNGPDRHDVEAKKLQQKVNRGGISAPIWVVVVRSRMELSEKARQR